MQNKDPKTENQELGPTEDNPDHPTSSKKFSHFLLKDSQGKHPDQANSEDTNFTLNENNSIEKIEFKVLSTFAKIPSFFQGIFIHDSPKITCS